MNVGFPDRRDYEVSFDRCHLFSLDTHLRSICGASGPIPPTAISRGRFRRLLVSDKYVSLKFYVKNLKKHRTRSNHTRRPWRSPARRAQADLCPRLSRLPHERGIGSWRPEPPDRGARARPAGGVGRIEGRAARHRRRTRGGRGTKAEARRRTRVGRRAPRRTRGGGRAEADARRRTRGNRT